MKILFVYPNEEGYPIIPLGISILAGVLRRYGYSIDLFDTTFMVEKRIDNDTRIKATFVKDVDMKKYWGASKNKNIEIELIKKLRTFEPDVVAFSIVENNYSCAKRLLDTVKRESTALTIVGGAFPTVASEFFINDSNVNIICLGEGEHALLEIIHRLTVGEKLIGIDNLLVKGNAGFSSCRKFSEFYNWEPNIYQNFELFDKRHFLKPFMGEVLKTGFFEMSRGCPYKCSFCANAFYQGLLSGLKRYHREKPIEYVIDEIEDTKNKYGLELVFFNDETFMMMSMDRFEKFSIEYTKRVNLPFFVQTRADTLLDLNRVKLLADAGCVMVGIGLESGNSNTRSELLGKNISDDSFIQAFENCKKCNLNTTVYAMMGLPFETRNDILNTARFCRKLEPSMLSINIFAPYYGTKLREICVKNGFMEDRLHEDIGMNRRSILTMPQISKEGIEELFYSFSDMVYGKGEIK